MNRARVSSIPPAGARHFDVIVVGGGSAGCILAAELSRDPGTRVLLLEHGDSATEHPETLTADGYKDAFINPALMHDRFSGVDPRWGDRRVFQGSGRGLGGGGSINGMVYTRGAEQDYAEWPEGWRWDDVQEPFEALEDVIRPHRRAPTEFTEACIEAAEQSGFRRGEDLNDGDLSGVLGYEWMSYEGQERRSSFTAFLRPALSRSNLVVKTRASVSTLLFDDARVSGVAYVHDGEAKTASAREVVLCAGALETPALLKRSGIGPREELARHGIKVRRDLPGVGENLHDHPNVTLFFRGRRDVDCNYPQLYGFHRANERSDLPAGQSDTCYVFYPARSSLREGMMRLLPGIVLPESLYEKEAIPSAMRSGIGALFGTGQMKRFVERLYGIVVILGKPKSRGRVTLRSADPSDPAVIDPGYFQDEEDLVTMVHGVKRARALAKTQALQSWGNTELFPGLTAKSDRAIEDYIRKNVMTTYHYAGSCKMGDDELAVVDTRLRVHGVAGLRVADSSVIPVTPVSAMNAPSMLIGYRAARFVLEDMRAPRAASLERPAEVAEQRTTHDA